MSGLIKQRQNLHQQLRENEDRITNLEQQIQATQKLATLGTMACLVAHEFNNILAPMINYAELALKNQEDVGLMRKALEKTIQHGNRASLVIQSMLGLVRDQTQIKNWIRLKEVVEDSFQCLARDFQKDNITVKLAIPDDFQVFVVPSQLQQVLVNLIINARQAMIGRGGILKVEAGSETDGARWIRVTDTGCGIPPEILDKIFEPFFTTKSQAEKPDQQGTGLGLLICKDIMESYGGKITVESTPGQGAAFNLWLPPVEEQNLPT